MSYKFRTRITESGLKHFELRLVPDRPQPNEIVVNPNGRRYSRSGRGISPNQADRLIKSMKKQLQETIAANNYCREGYWILKVETFERTPYVRGECNELATGKDRMDFPDTINNW